MRPLHPYPWLVCLAYCLVSCGSEPAFQPNAQQNSAALAGGCQTTLQPGERCDVEANCCADDLICLDNICMAKPEAATCDKSLDLGEVCDAAEVTCCVEGLQCADNICVPAADPAGR